jgi:hypothetical protein
MQAALLKLAASKFQPLKTTQVINKSINPTQTSKFQIFNKQQQIQHYSLKKTTNSALVK